MSSSWYQGIGKEVVLGSLGMLLSAGGVFADCRIGTLCHVNSAKANPAGTFSKAFIQDHKLASGVMSVKQQDGSWKGFCSGTLIYANLFLTSGHCMQNLTMANPNVNEQEDIAVTFNFEATASTADSASPQLENNRPWAKFRHVIEDGTDMDTDYALVVIRWVSLPVLKIDFPNPSGPRVGQEVLAIQHPLGKETQVSAGTISAIDQLWTANSDASYSNASYRSQPGSSGGGIYGKDGRLIGVLSGVDARGKMVFAQMDKIVAKSSRLSQYLNQGLPGLLGTPFLIGDAIWF